MERLCRKSVLGPDNQLPHKPSSTITRREFILFSLAIIAPFVITNHKIQNRIFDNFDFSEDLRDRLNTRFYFHNAANDPKLFEEALQSSTSNVEIDVVSFQGKLYVAHSLSDLKKMREEKQDGQLFETVLGKIIASGKNPAFDLKLDRNDHEGFAQFKDIVDHLVPENRLATFSGRLFSFLDQIPSSDQRIVVYTLDSDTKEEYLARAKKWEKEEITGRGATIRTTNPILAEILEFNASRGFETNIWPVNRNLQVINLLRMGATGITSDNERILAKASMTLAS